MADRKDKNVQPQDGADPNAWMVTFGDLIMLLLTFFVLLLTMKSMDAGALKEKFQELAPTSGPLDYADKSSGGSVVKGDYIYKKSIVVKNNNMLEDVLDLLAGIERQSAKEHHLEKLRTKIDIDEDARGIVIVMECDHLFDSGKAEIKSDRFATLDALGKLFRTVVNDVLIMGHTDNQPVRGGAFESNLELSVYRAMSVLFYLTEGLGVQSRRFAAGGYGDFRPKYSNESEAGRSKNRRVEFILKKPT